MRLAMFEAAVDRSLLLADISGSTALYDTVGNEEGARRIHACLDAMRDAILAAGGRFVGAKGDDVLASFDAADAALTAARFILDAVPTGGLAVHVGLHFGSVVSARNDIFGDAVNVTARLAGAANPGEVLISEDFVAQLLPEGRAALRPLAPMSLKGKPLPMGVYSLGQDTRIFEMAGRGAAGPPAPLPASIAFRFEDREVRLMDAQNVAIGRASDNAFVVDRPWVSRRHATIAVSAGRVQFTDHSSYGTWLTLDATAEFLVRRETVLLVGRGRFSLGITAADEDAAVIEFEVGS
ncbi:hypothetical protein GCM10011390_22580 [Aureimonas endophytica]|uniref:Class 3 adenylate cyclase n=1 Tax=Aureimonas endophytica TaxID=2027858 RepID=A0A916ZMN0_9HYPH|nr:adenylate/guanylate cyclase domain-containing protein [Aureimonas endophytica]GGE03207.1 hypothetical protein GCM10011390_22580 [Aureimonas endophytica]